MIEMQQGKTIRRKLSRLKDHPKQARLFGDVSDAELEALADDMRKHGQRDPVEILPDGTILAGHQRVRAARWLKWNEIDVIVRHDLAKAGVKAQDRYFISDNLIRRHSSPLGRARCLHHLMEIETDSRAGALSWEGKEALKKQLGERLNLSARSVSRYLLVLAAPPAIQNAFDAGELTLVQAGKVALLEKQKQREIAQRIKAGESARSVVASFLPQPSKSKHQKVGDAVRSLIRGLERALNDLDGRLEKVVTAHVADHRAVLEQTTPLVEKLLALSKAKRKSMTASIPTRRSSDEEE